MESKNELLVFSKKEVFLIVLLLVLVALFSFTLGVKMGKTLALSKHLEANNTTEPPLTAQNNEVVKDQHEHESNSHELTDAHNQPAQENTIKRPTAAEDLADTQLAHETSKEKLSVSKPIAMAYPTHKKGATSSIAVPGSATHSTATPDSVVDSGAAHDGVVQHSRITPDSAVHSRARHDGRYTLQVGAYRTIAEADEQITELKQRNLDAFSFEAHVSGKTWYRVGIGQFSNKETAEQHASQLKASTELPPYLVQKIP